MLFLVVVSLLLSIPAIQTKLGKVATNYLRNDFDVDINIDKVSLAYLGNVQLKDIFIKDHHGDTLILAKNLTTSIFSYKNILNNKLEFGTIHLEDFILNIKTYKNEIDDGLTVFVDKFDDGTISDKPSGFLLTASNLKLENGYVKILDENDENQNPIYFNEINGEANNFRVEGPNVSVNINDFSFIENHNLKVEHFKSDFTYTKSFMNFENSVIKTASSSILADIKFTYKREDFSDFNNLVNLKATVNNADISLTDLKNFYKEFGTNDVLHFSTEIEGTLNNFTAHKLQLKTDKNAIINGDLNFKNVLNQENGFSFDGDFLNLTSDYNHLKILLPKVLGNSLPTSFEKLGRFTLIGKSHITSTKIDAKLTLKTDLGTSISDLVLTNIDNIDNAAYKGHIKVIDFKLGEVIKDSLVGVLSMEADIDGKGFTLENLNTAVKGKVSKHQYKNYTYKNINLNGLFKNKHFDGEMEVNDDNIKLNFNGLADLSGSVYKFDFKTTVDYCDLNTLNLFKRDSISKIKGDILIDLKGNTIDDLEGTINFKNSLYLNQKGNYFFKDFNVTSSFSDSVRTITINSPEIITGKIVGNFKFNELSKLTQNSIGSIYSNYKPYKVTSNQNLEFGFNVHNKIVEVFYPEIILSPTTTIKGSINSNENLFKLNIKSPKVDAFQNEIEELKLQIDNKNPLFNTQLTVDKINSSIYDISDLHLVNITLSDTLYFRTEFKGGEKQTENFELSFYHTFNKQNKSVFGLQKSNFTFKHNKWIINPEDNLKNNVVFDGKTKTYDINSFLIATKNEKIEFSGTIKDTIYKNLNFKFKDVKLSSITPDIDSLKLVGVINGNLNYNQLEKVVKPTANLKLSNFKVNNSLQGDLNINIEGKNSIKKYGVNMSLVRDKNITFSAVGELDFEPIKPVMDIVVDFEAFKLDALSPLGEDVISNIRGFAYGNVNLTGEIRNPSMLGDLYLDQAGLGFPYLNVDYNFEGTSVITLTDQTFNLEDVLIQDNLKKSRGSLNGTISHKFFDNWKLNLELVTSNLLVLNTEEDETSVYYGTGFLAGNATIKGLTDKLVIDVNGKTNKGTRFVIPISDVKTVETSQLIRFVVPEDNKKDTKTRKQIVSEKLKGLSLNFNIEVTKDAIVEMVLDKSTGSYLKGSGTGNLQLELDTKDKFNMYGDFIVDNGIYNFKYGGIINKPFIVERGGSVSWSGDPFTADINIEAIYRVSANPKSLLDNITTNRKIPIDLITRFSGELFNSQRTFDIEIPNSSSTVASELAFKLNNNDTNSKTIHFMALLATGSFYNESNLSVNSTGLVYGTTSDLLSNAFDNIVNKGNSKFKLKPVYTFGEKNRIDNLNINDQLGLDFDYQLNDKIIINGKASVPIGSKEQTNIIGEVNVDFLMNDEGTLKSSIFNRQNEINYSEQEEEGYTQGVGINYQIDFDNSRELLEKLGLKKKKQKDSIKTPTKEIENKIKSEKFINIKSKNKNKDE
ncbi:translocation/assembly module TamB domain-containing protein [uncultured Lutibacter sp.]|uniref:translocation/assembly module TamB domain-containing protein n=1 Tax=uncultured Lutibacter sp. TaxID=437739 RepID=UPI0026042199|nr:translocation/assembly module TamB domain-containing protein [uncultured Lutibacter sp.]